MDDFEKNLLNTCIICNEKNSKANPVIKKNPTDDKAKDLLERCKLLKQNGDNSVTNVLQRILGAKEAGLFGSVVYHSECRKPLMHEKRKSSSSSLTTPLKKVGRPGKATSEERPKRTTSVPKEKKCMFSNCSFCPPACDTDLHRVYTDSVGNVLLFVKENTTVDAVRISVADLTEPGHASSFERHYHRQCLRNAQRSCKTEHVDDKLTRSICDELLVLSVKSSLFDEGTVLSMKDINAEYVSILDDYGIRSEYSGDQRKHIKEVLMKNVPGVSFVKSLRRNESETVSLDRHVSEAMEFALSHSTSIETMSTVAKVLREEALEYRDWKFESDLNDFQCPPKLMFFISQLLFGRFSKGVTGKRDVQLQKTQQVVSQFILQNVRTDRQVKHKSKTDEGFRSTVETPLSIGVPLAVHAKSRDKGLIDMLNMIGVGKNYQYIVNIEKRTEQAVLKRIEESGGFCLPNFIKGGMLVWFALDNIDLLEDTPYGQNTFHGTVIVIFQRETEEGVPMNPPLKIPIKLPSEPLKMTLEYLEEPVIQQKPIRFESFATCEREHLLENYNHSFNTWLLANFLGNDKPNTDETDDSLNVEDEAVQNDQVCSSEETLDLNNISCTNPEVRKQIFNVTNERRVRSKVDKTKTMPTWAATNSLLLSKRTVNRKKKVNAAAIAPLFKTSPTDYSTLYTALCLTQEISASVVGPNRRTLITLDLDLYNRALQIQESVLNKNWILLPGGLHACFAIEHALGKTIEGSGIDTCAVECGTYSEAALRGVHSGKAFKRAVEYHLINATAFTAMKFEALPENLLTPALQTKCKNLRDALHARNPSMTTLFDEIQNEYVTNIQVKLTKNEDGGLAQFLDNYLEQVENLLQIISASRREDWEGYLAALEGGIKYFFAHDLLNYARLIPIHIAQMNQLKSDDPEVWASLVAGEFVVNKSGIPFSSLFTDQALEQEIKHLKRHGGIVGISQNEDALDRMMLSTPHLSNIVKSYLDSFLGKSDTTDKEHYQLQGSFSIRITQNAIKLHNRFIQRCDGNPYENGIVLKNIVSSAVLPDVAKEHILNFSKIGQKRYSDFVSERLQSTSLKSVWDTFTKLKLKNFSNWMAKTKIRVGDKIIKLREERQLFARFLVIQQSRPELFPKLSATIGEFEMAVVPRSMFANDGSLLVCKEKYNLMKMIEAATPQPSNDSSVSKDDEDDQHLSADGDALPAVVEQPLCRVLVIDAMATLQGIKKSPGMTAIRHLKETFINKIMNMARRYDEVRVLFDYYREDSLKSKTRASRATSVAASKASYDVNDQMCIKTLSLKELLSSSHTKNGLTKLLAEAILKHNEGSSKKYVVSYHQCTKVNVPHTIDDEFKEHSHEEADTLIPLHVLDSLKESMAKEVHVRCSDTDVFILLMDLASKGHLGVLSKLVMLAGTGAKYREIDIKERVAVIRSEKARGLIGLHNFTGADWGGKFVGISKTTWAKTYLSLNAADDIVDTFASLGQLDVSAMQIIDSKLPVELVALERFVCATYAPSSSPSNTLSSLRWELFQSKNLEGELLPPTVGTLFPHIQRTNFICMRDKSYTAPRPILPNLENNGWNLKEDGTGYEPVRCIKPPAPSAVLELVKCGCRTSCSGKCSCLKNNLPCTPLCKCFVWGCNRYSSNQVSNDDDKDDNEDDTK